ncbi:MAG: cell division protein FtsA [Candidatus Aenigmarchaeota archaeon]|nr:cell division protein FtsA [Candidatus Aenigmarchaeota archaeon]
MAKYEEVFVGLDIGTSKVATIVGTLEDKEVPSIIGVGITPTLGMRKGSVVDIPEVTGSIVRSVEAAERMAGVPIDRAYININGSHISSLNSKGVIAVGRADNEISLEDIVRAQEAAQAVSIPSNREILHVIPRNYTVDGQEGIKDPIGMNGVRLEVETHIITGSQQVIKNLTKCISQANIQTEKLILTPLAASRAVLTKRQKELGVVLIDIGAGTTGIAVYEEGDILFTAILPVGAAHITNDIAIGLRTSVDIAEKVKLKYGQSSTKKIAGKERLKLSEFSENEEGEFTKKHLAEIIEARLSELFQMVKLELRKVGKDGMLPAGAVLTGGGAKLQDLVDFAKDSLKLPAQIGYPSQNLKGIIDKVHNPLYATSVGLMLSGIDDQEIVGANQKIGAVIDKIKKILRSFLP